ncbi:MAG: outer membrane beta-barrel protein [Syntrophaceae bacterium]|nr:outer membrane beta-barrel protein [Syntrophaceae bacterium]
MNPKKCILFFLSCLLWLSSAPLVQAADLLSKFHPYLSIKEQFSNNLDLTSTNEKKDFYTTVQPGIKFSNMDERGGLDLDYSLGAVFYSKYTNLNYISHKASMNAKYMTSQHINFYLKESFIRSEDTRESEYYTTTEENKYVLSTQRERAVYWRNVLSPTIEYQFGPENRLGLNYRNNLYRTDSSSGNDSHENFVNPFFTYWFDKRNGISLDYGFTKGDFETSPDLTGHRASARYTNRFSERSSIFGEYAYSKRVFDSPGVDYDIHEPIVGITYALTPTLNASAQAGYFWKVPESGSRKDGFSYKADLKNIDPRTTFQISIKGGYTEDFFTSENLGFNRYHRVTGSVTHMLDRHISIGAFGSYERAEFDQPEHKDDIWGIGARASYSPLKWLTLALEISRRNRNSDVSTYDYTENRGMLTVTATY